jgi:hypothetical protein
MNNPNVKVFAIESTLSSFPSYVICGANLLDDAQIHGESFLLAVFKGRKAKLVPMDVVMPNKIGELQIDSAFVIEECLTQAKFNLLEIGKTKIPRYGTGDLPFIHKTTEIDAGYLFHGFFMQDEIKNKIELIAKVSKIDAIKQLMERLSNAEKFSFAPINT